MKVRLDSDTLAFMQLFSTITKVSPVDCFNYGEDLVFVVPAEMMGKAIGKGGKMTKILSKAFNKSVMVFPYAKDPRVLLKVLFPMMKKCEINDNAVVEIESSSRSEVLRNKRYLNIKKMIVKRLLGKELVFKWS